VILISSFTITHACIYFRETQSLEDLI